ncbi:hypothetical protein JTE90_025922 [Oedothorax gibbosus]|uniref:Caspase-8 n=1 Tax=Oedothorax gibbosus TaxID=931172 RepID=A0AAV6UUS5_9ARAC|nr:hypothetical protein JTE90_025922 [Oedothorax gibbosus]
MGTFYKKKPPEPVEYLGKEDSECYPMNYKKKGLCYIFNHENFKGPELGFLNQRIGTDIDAHKLKNVFEKLDFVVDDTDVVEFKDYTYGEIVEKLQLVHKLDKSEYSFFVCCILSYGKEDYLCSCEDIYPVQNIYQLFLGDKCKAFAGKPKIFFIQACPFDVDVSSTESTDSGKPNAIVFRIPTRSDFLVVYSTIPGDLSWNLNSNQGSWFIDALCSTIKNHISEMDLLQLLIIVNEKLSEMHNSKGLPVEVSCVTSTLIRDIKLIDSGSGGSEIQRYELVSNGRLRKGKVLIFNHEVYENNRRNRRNGTDNDVKCLKTLFPRSDFKLCSFKDKTKKFIFQELHKAAKSHKKYGCFICCILTHGNLGTLSAFDKDYEISELLSCFHNKWSGKPKVFLLQACRGKILDPGFEMTESLSMTDSSDSESSATDSDFEEIVSEVPVNFRHLSHPDFLLLSSAPPGCLSFRSTSGSWFVQELWKVFTSFSGQDKDFLQLFTETNREVAKRVSKNKKIPSISDKKLTLCLTSTLTRNLDFRSLN